MFLPAKDICDDTSQTEDPNTIRSEEKQAWYVVHTRSRHERKVRQEIANLSMEVFFPEYIAWSKRKDRRKRITKALFPGYLFVRTVLNPENRLALIKTPSLVRIVGIGNVPVPVPEYQIESVKILLGKGADLTPCSNVTPGQLVQVIEGPLSGVVGVVEQTRKQIIIVNIDLVGRSVAARLDQAVLVPYLEG